MPVLLAMAGLAFMAASVPDIHGDRAKVFAIAYIAVRALADRVWESRRGGVRVIVDWPVAQLGFGVVPWVVSLWVDSPWRYGLWALGLALDLVITFAVSGDRLVANITAKLANHEEPRQRPTLARLDTVHFGERLGLFTIIVLGEGVLNVTDAMAATPEWNHSRVFLTVIAALALLATLWGTSLNQGFGGIPYLAADALGPRLLLPLHCLVAGLLAAFAGALGDAVESVSEGHLETSTRWLLCGSIAAFAVIGSLAGLAAGRGVQWAVVTVIPGLAILLALGLAGLPLAPGVFLWLLVVAAGAGLLWRRAAEPAAA